MSATALATVIDAAPQGATVTSRSIPNVDAQGATLLDPATNQPYTLLVLAGLLSDADASANGPPPNQCRFVPYQSYDGGLSWAPLDPVYTWTGGTSPRDGSFTRPSSTFPVARDGQGRWPTNFRVELDPLTDGLNVGAQLGLATP